MNTIIITNGHLIAFFLGTVVGMVLTTVTIGLMIPSMVGNAFKKAKKEINRSLNDYY